MKIKDIEYITDKTKKGLEYILFSDKKSYSITITLIAKTGATHDVIPGTSHFLEHMVYRSTHTKNYKKKQKELEYRGSNKDGATSYEYNEYSISLPYTQLEWGFKYIEDLLLNAAFFDKEFDLERKVIIDEISKSDNSPYDLLYNETKQNYLTPNSPFYQDIAGTKETMQKQTKEDLLKFYKNYNNENILFGVSGRFENEKVLGLLEDLSNKIYQKNGSSKFSFKDIERNKAEKIKIVPSKLSRNTLAWISSLEKGYNKTNLKSNIVKDLLSAIVITGDSSHLYQVLREDKGYLYGYYNVSYAYNPFALDGLIFESDPEFVLEILKDIKSTFNKVRKDKIKNSEVNHWKNYIKNRLLIKNDNHASILRGLLKSKFNYGEIITPKQNFEIVSQIESKDINEILDYIDVSRKDIVLFGNVKDIKKEAIEKVLF